VKLPALVLVCCQVTFRPSVAGPYRCRFRFEVEAGEAFDVVSAMRHATPDQRHCTTGIIRRVTIVPQ
jgi:hypothetical protein